MKKNNNKKSKITIIKVDTYNLVEEAKIIEEQENKGFIHYFVAPFPYGTGRMLYFRKRN